MVIGIIGAMEEEISRLKELVTNQMTEKHYQFEFIKGILGDQSVVLVKSGIGKVNATISAALLIEHYQVDFIINTGSAGAVDPALKIGDIVIAHSLIHHDVDVTDFNYDSGQMAGMPQLYFPDTELKRVAQIVCRELNFEPIIGQIASGDQFVGNRDMIKQIRQQFPSVRAVDMESAAIAQTAYVMETPFIIIRSISDNADEEANVSFDQFIKTAGKASAEIVGHLVTKIGKLPLN